ncbi:MAG: hypothetical protein ACRDCV_14060 [Plesiomonas shigelloides]
MGKKYGVRSTDGKGIELLRMRMNKLKDHAVSVGVHESAGKHEKSGQYVAFIAACNEYGTEKIPERSFFRTTLEERKRAYEAALRKIVKRAIEGKGADPKILMGRFGRMVQQDIQKKIVDIQEPPNAESTIARKKGVDNPLVDTGQMLNSIRWEYVNVRDAD